MANSFKVCISEYTCVIFCVSHSTQVFPRTRLARGWGCGAAGKPHVSCQQLLQREDLVPSPLQGGNTRARGCVQHQVHCQQSLLLLPGVHTSALGPERESQDHGRLPPLFWLQTGWSRGSEGLHDRLLQARASGSRAPHRLRGGCGHGTHLMLTG